MKRSPARDGYDALVDLFPWDGMPTVAYGVVKITYALDERGLRRLAAEPLLHDIRRPSERRKHPRGSDFVPYKSGADVVVLGNAYAPRDPAEPWRDVSVRVGPLIKRLRVFGTRILRRTPGRAPRIEHVEPLTLVPLTREEAYGGGAPRTELEARRNPVLRNLTASFARIDGVYPRNPYGKGFWALDSSDEEIPLPRVEDPSDLLTVERVAGQFERPWTELPLPWHLDWTSLDQFPRFVLGTSELTPGPNDELPEVRRGLWPAEWLDEARLEPFVRDAALFQEASLGLVWRDPQPGAPIELAGMHPERDRLSSMLAPPPRMEIEIDGSRAIVEPRLLNLVLVPDEQKLTVTWTALRRDLPRKLVPGLHGHIPLRLYVDGDAPIEYETPPPAHALLRRAELEGHARPRPATRAGSSIDLEGLLATETPVRDRDQAPPERLDMLGDVDVPTGRLLITELDWALEGASFPFALSRSYASSRAWRAGVLGPGWTHPLEQAVWIEHGYLLYRTSDGRELYVGYVGAGELGLGQSVHHPLEGVSVRRVSSDGYDVLRSDGWRMAMTTIPSTIQVGPVEARITRLSSPLGVTAELRYDAHGRLVHMILPSRSELRFEHDARGRLVAVYAPTADGAQHAVAARYDYDLAGQLVGAMDGSRRTSRYRYADRRIIERIARGGGATRYRYDAEGSHARVMQERRTDAAAREHSFSPRGRVVVAIDGIGRARSVEVDPAHRAIRMRDAHGCEVRREYDEATGLLLAETRRGGSRVERLYDAAGHLAEETHAGGARVVVDHDGFGHLLARTDADGNTERWGWDDYGRLHAFAAADGGSTTYEYDDAGRVAALVAPRGLRATFEHDASGLVASVRTPLGERRVTRDALGRPREIVDEEGSSAHLRFDPSGCLREVAFEGDVRLAIERGPDGAVARFTDGIVDTTIQRDGYGRVSAVRRGGEEEVALHYDAEDRVTLVQSATLELHELRYDARGDLAEESSADGAITRYRHDADQRLIGVLRSDCAESRYERDACGRVVAALHGELEERFAWSAAGQLTSARAGTTEVHFERDGAGRIVREIASFGDHSVELRSAYDAGGRRVALESSAGLTVHVERDVTGAPHALTIAGHERPWRVSFHIDARSDERERELPGGLRVRLDRDALGRVTRRRVLFEGRALHETSYAWAGLGRLTSIDDSRDSITRLIHDARGHLVGVHRGAGEVLRSVDAAGNIYRVRSQDDHLYGPAGRLLEGYGVTYEYDRVGRRIEKRSADGSVTRYRWEGPSRLAEVELPEGRRVGYAYDALGRVVSRRVERREGSTFVLERERRYVWDGLALVHEIEGDEVTSWIWLDGRLAATVQGQRCYGVLTDPLGVVSELVDESSALVWRGGVDVFGAGWRDVERARQPWRWPGHLEDEDTGLAMSLLRAYDAEAAQYLSPCPLGISAGPSPYSYVRDPASEVSPLGLGPGLEPHYGAALPRAAESLHVELLLASLDRGDGSAGPRARFETPSSMLPDPNELVLGLLARCAPDAPV